MGLEMSFIHPGSLKYDLRRVPVNINETDNFGSDSGSSKLFWIHQLRLRNTNLKTTNRTVVWGGGYENLVVPVVICQI